MNKEIQYRYNEVDYRQRLKLLVSLYFQREQSKIGNYIVFLVMSVLLGSAFLYFDSDRSGIIIGPLLIIVAMFYLGVLIRFYQKKKQFEKEYFNKVDQIIERLNSNGGLIHYSFTDDFFFHSDHDYEIKTRWSLLESYLLLDDYLFIIGDNQFGIFTLGRRDIASSDFDEICSFVASKLPLSKLAGTDQRKSNPNNPDLLDSNINN